MMRLFSSASMGAAALLAVVVPAVLEAAEEGQVQGQLEEVVVTAQKRAENLQSVPIAVTAVNAEQLQASGVEDVMALPTVTSGLSVGATTGNFSPHIRGIGTTAYGLGIESPVALYVDGVYYASQLTGMSDLGDVSQVTVLKGPQGTLFGRNATGGVIQLNTRDPDSTFNGEARTELDRYLTTRSNVYITDGLSEDIRANLSLGYATQGNGWGRNLYDGSDTHKIDHDVSARSKIFFTPSVDTTVKLNFDYADRANSLFGNFVPAPGTSGHAPGFESSSNPYDIDSSLDPYSTLKSGGTSLDIDQELGFAHLVSVSAYRRYAWRTQFDASLTPTPELLQHIQFQGNQFSQEFQLVSNGSPDFRWMLGLYYFRAGDQEELHQNTYDVASAPFTAGQVIEGARSTTNSGAPFGQTTIRVLPDTHLTLGLRYTVERRTLDGAIMGGFYGLPADPGLVVPITGLDLNDSKSYNKLTYRAALDHDFTPDVLGYMSYSTGFKSGGFNGFNPSALNPAYNPEVVDAYEVGLKSEVLDQRLRLNTALFYNKYSDIQIINFISIPTISNAATARTYGVDVDAEAVVSKELYLTAGLEYLHSRFGSGSSGTVTTFVPGTDRTSSMLGSIDGHELPFAPQLTANIGITYTRIFGWGKVETNVTNAYTSRQFYSEDNFLPQTAYDYVNTSLGWTASDGRLTVNLWGRNLLNKRVAGFLTSGAVGYAADYSNPPRNYGFTAIYRFGK